MQIIHARAWVLMLAALLLVSGCTDTPASPSPTISREQAIEFAQRHVPFEPTSVDAEPAVHLSRPVWIVTMRRADGSRGGLGQFAQVVVDRSSGVIVSTAIR
jgi:hypothetical protein